MEPQKSQRAFSKRRPPLPKRTPPSNETESKIKSWQTGTDFSKSQVKMPKLTPTEALLSKAVTSAVTLKPPPPLPTLNEDKEITDQKTDSSSSNNNAKEPSSSNNNDKEQPPSPLPAIPRNNAATLKDPPPSTSNTTSTATASTVILGGATKTIPRKSTTKRVPSKTTKKSPPTRLVASETTQKQPPASKKRPAPTTNDTSSNTTTKGRTAQPVWEGAPDDPGLTGWTLKKFVRQGGATKGHLDRYWYTPVLKKKLRSLTEVKKFNGYLQQHDNDEQVAWEYLKGKRR